MSPIPMSAGRKRNRIYWRNRGGIKRAYGDFRDYAAVGGGLEALIGPGESRATTDPDIARALVTARVKGLDAKRLGRAIHGRSETTGLAAYAAEHLEKKAKAAKVTTDWIAMAELFLRRAVDYFGADRDLESIGVQDVQDWASHLATTPYRRKGDPEGKGRRLSGGSVRHALNALSNLYRRAQAEGRVPPGFSPVAAMLEKPTGVKREARWLEVHDAALLLESARTLPPAAKVTPDALTAEVAHALIATFLLTGGRSAEVLGLEVADISFDRATVTIRPHEERRLKTLTSARVVPMWPQLEEILRPFIFTRPPTRLLFPSFVTGQEAMLIDWRGTLDRCAMRAGWKRGEIRSKMFRHTYCAARLQTLDGGAPVSPFTVGRELGHGSETMLREVYSHLGTIRHRSDTPEYRVEQHEKALQDRLSAMRSGLAVTATVTNGINASQHP